MGRGYGSGTSRSNPNYEHFATAYPGRTTEQDTFDRLKRTPFEELISKIDSLPIANWLAICGGADGASEFYKLHGWTEDEYITDLQRHLQGYPHLEDKIK